LLEFVSWRLIRIGWPTWYVEWSVDTVVVSGDKIWNAALDPCGTLALVTTNDPQLLVDCQSVLFVPFQVTVCVFD
jgi:hypothetical protein